MKNLVSCFVILGMLSLLHAYASAWPAAFAKEGYSIGWESDGQHRQVADATSDLASIVRNLELNGYVVSQDDNTILVTPKIDAVTDVLCSLSSSNESLSNVVAALRTQTGVQVFPLFLRQEVLKKPVNVDFKDIPLKDALSRIAKSAGFSTWVLAPFKDNDTNSHCYAIDFR